MKFDKFEDPRYGKKLDIDQCYFDFLSALENELTKDIAPEIREKHEKMIDFLKRVKKARDEMQRKYQFYIENNMAKLPKEEQKRLWREYESKS